MFSYSETVDAENYGGWESSQARKHKQIERKKKKTPAIISLTTCATNTHNITKYRNVPEILKTHIW